MTIAIRNLHRVGVTGFAFHNYVIELLKSGYVTHLYFDESPFTSETFRQIRWRYDWKTLGLDRVKVIFDQETLNRECDVLLNFESLPNDFTPAIKQFPGLKIFHLMDYFWNEPLSEKVKRLNEYGIEYVFSYGSPDRHCSYFQRFASEFSGRVIPLPFGFASRFVDRRPFAQRKQKCVAVGSVRPLRFDALDPHLWKEPADFFAPALWFHAFRRRLVEHKEALTTVMDSMLPEFPRYRDYDYDMVEKLNEYQLFTSDESIFHFPSAKAFEGPATGAVMVCSDHPCFTDYGFVDGKNCLMHKQNSIEDFQRVVETALQEQGRLQAIAAEGKRFVTERYSHASIAAKLGVIIKYLYEEKKAGRSVTKLADFCYQQYTQPVAASLSQTSDMDIATVCRQRRAYVWLGGAYALSAEARLLAKRIILRLTRDGQRAQRLAERVSQKLATLVYDTHPFDDRRRADIQRRHMQASSPSPTAIQQQFIDRVRARIKDLPPLPSAITLDPPARKWRLFSETLREQILTQDPRSFLSWQVIRANMGYRANTREWKYLQQSPLWPRLREAMREPVEGRGLPFFAWPETSENTVRQAYHLARMQASTGVKVEDMDVIVDFGGGYGCMARLVQALGFKGAYIVFDWPEFLALQEFYLRLTGVSVPIQYHPQVISGPSVIQVSDIAELQHICQLLPKEAKKLLIATWSLSESPVALREQILAAVRPDAYLLAYQQRFAGVLNGPYFKQVTLDFSDIIWKDEPMPYIPAEKNRYLFGRR